MENESRQLWAKNADGAIIEIAPGAAEGLRVARPEGYHCLDPQCSVMLRPRGGQKVRDHFYHVSPVIHSGETWEHLLGKAMLHSWVQRSYPHLTATQEKTLRMVHGDSTSDLRRPDVLIEGEAGTTPLALEVEYKRYELEEWERKERDLRLNGVNSAWLFGLSKIRRGKQEDSIYLPQLMEQLVLRGEPKPLYILDPSQQRIGLFSTHERLTEDGYTDYGYSQYSPPVRQFSIEDLHLVPLEQCWFTDELQLRGPWDYEALAAEQADRAFSYHCVSMKAKQYFDSNGSNR